MSTARAQSRVSPALLRRDARALRPRRDPDEPPAREPAPRRRAPRSGRACSSRPGGARRAAAHGGVGDDERDARRARGERVLLLEARLDARRRARFSRATASARGSMSLPKSARSDRAARARRARRPSPRRGPRRRRPRERPRRAPAPPRGWGATRRARRLCRHVEARIDRAHAARVDTSTARSSRATTTSQVDAVGSLTSSGARAAMARDASQSPRAGGRPRPTRCGSGRPLGPRGEDLARGLARRRASDGLGERFARATDLGRQREREPEHRSRSEERVDRSGEARAHSARSLDARLHHGRDPGSSSARSSSSPRRRERDEGRPAAPAIGRVDSPADVPRRRALDHHAGPARDARELRVVGPRRLAQQRQRACASHLAERRREGAAHLGVAGRAPRRRAGPLRRRARAT